jgi:hypothetical protein
MLIYSCNCNCRVYLTAGGVLKGCIEHTLQYSIVSRGIVVSCDVSKSCI